MVIFLVRKGCSSIFPHFVYASSDQRVIRLIVRLRLCLLALKDNIARKGKNAYYYAHGHGANGPGNCNSPRFPVWFLNVDEYTHYLPVHLVWIMFDNFWHQILEQHSMGWKGGTPVVEQRKIRWQYKREGLPRIRRLCLGWREKVSENLHRLRRSWSSRWQRYLSA